MDLGQQTMFGIMRSSRSHVRREQSVERQSQRSSSTAWPMPLAGIGRHHLSRTDLETAASENAAPQKPQQPFAFGGSVLGDVTNRLAPGVAESQAKLQSYAAPICEPGPALLTRMGRDVPIDEPVSALLASMGAAISNSSHQVDPDVSHADDPQYVMEYMSDIFRAMQRDEGLHAASPAYMERQLHVNAKMRGILVDWLVSVQQKYKLKAETLFLAVSLLDRYLEARVAARRHLQLVGVTVLLIAAKFEEMYPPKIEVLVYVTDKAYSRDDIIKMEVAILTALDFKICGPTPMHFLERYQSVNGCTESHRSLSQYLVELALPDYNMLKYGASMRAASAVFLSNKLLCHQPAWKAAAVKHSCFTEAMLKDCAKEMCGLLECAESNPLQAVRKKFSQPKFQSVAKLDFVSTNRPRQTFEDLRSNIRRPSFSCERRRSVMGKETSLGMRLPLGESTDV